MPLPGAVSANAASISTSAYHADAGISGSQAAQGHASSGSGGSSASASMAGGAAGGGEAAAHRAEEERHSEGGEAGRGDAVVGGEERVALRVAGPNNIEMKCRIGKVWSHWCQSLQLAAANLVKLGCQCGSATTPFMIRSTTGL